MTINTKRPMMKETVGAQYYAFNTPDEDGNVDLSTFEQTIKTEVVKKIGTKENGETTPVRSSGKDYASFNQVSSVDLEVEVVAFPQEDLSRMRGETVATNGLASSGGTKERPYFAYGKVVKLVGGGVRYDWYPKCQVIENTDDIATSEEKFSEQNDTITIRCYPFNDNGEIKNYLDSTMRNFPEGITEEKFFEKPIVTPADLDRVLSPEA